MELTKMKMKFPKLRGERLVIVALVMILVAELISNFWSLEYPGANTANSVQKFIAQKSSFQNVLVDRLELFGYSLLVISLISTGIRQIRNKWTSFKGIAMTIIGVCFCLYHLLSIQAYTKIGKTLDELPRPNFEIMKSQLNNEKLPLKTKVKLSKMYAHDKFFHEGIIVEYLSDSGEMNRYVPTKEDLEFRKVQSDAREIWAYNNKRLPIVFRWWVAVAVTSLLLGVLTPIRMTAPNQGSDHERA
jgi:hypothetical protein